MTKQRPTSIELFQREVAKIDRRIMKPGTTPEEKQKLMVQRKQLFAASTAAESEPMPISAPSQWGAVK
jgi:hypothetical protein